MRTGLATAMALGALFAVPAMASAAGTVSTAGSVITYTGDTGINVVSVDDSGSDAYQFTETGIAETSPNCTLAANTVSCSGTSWTQVVMNMGDAADSANASATADDDFLISGGLGDDVLRAGNIGDVINGGDNNDSIIGGAGPDDINGDAGNDRLDGGDNGSNADDDVDGGSGLDRLVFGIIAGHTYACAVQPVTLDMDNAADDDSCSEGNSDDNNYRDTIESVTGSTLNDTFTGSCFSNTFAGSAGTAPGHTDGDDVFNGDPAPGCAPTGGGDFFGGGEGSDDFNGDGANVGGFDTVTYGAPYTGLTALSIDWGGGNDDADGMGNNDDVQTDIERVIGGGAGDTINATAAAQGVQLFGRLGGDTLTGSGFGDHLNGEDGTDSLNCLGGTDTFSDPSNADTIDVSCETEI